MKKLLALSALSLFVTLGVAAEPFFRFRDAAKDSGAGAVLSGMRSHAAAWGDFDGDGRPDLFVGTFHTSGKSSRLLRNLGGGKFAEDPQEAVRVSACASGALFVDLDNTGRLDLYVGCNANGKDGVRSRPSRLFRNDGKGKLVDVSEKSAACPPGVLARTVAAADLDGDGRLDLVVTDFYYSPKAKYGVRIFRNKGGHAFDDVTEASGVPGGVAFPGVAAADLNGDGVPDLVVTAADGSNRVLLNDGKGKFTDNAECRKVFAWKVAKDDPVAGVAVADVNGDGLPDVLIGHHFKQPWRSPASIRLYLHRGVKAGVPSFEDVTEAAGLAKIGMKAPHVEIQDMDNDGLPDLVASVVKFADGRPHPLIYKNLGPGKGGVPTFEERAWAVNDFPNKADLAPGRTADFYARVLKERKITYTACAPVCDYDGDGRLDVAFPVWWEDEPPMLLRNETPSGGWLDVRVVGKGKVNRQGVGAVVRLLAGGKVVAAREIALGHGWCSGGEAAAHFGLGRRETVDVEVTLPWGGGKVVKKGVRANGRVVVE